MKKIVIFASGEGTTADYFLNEIKNQNLKVQVKAFVVDRDCEAIQVAKKHNIPCVKIAPFKGVPLALWDRKLIQFLKATKADYVLLLGFLRRLGKPITEAFPQKVINTHPSLLPAYGGKGMYGAKIHIAVLANKETKTGVTIHYINENYDEGQIIAQKEVEVLPSDTAASLETKVKQIEKGFLVETLSKIFEI